jgi:hypothetical protein
MWPKNSWHVEKIRKEDLYVVKSTRTRYASVTVVH